MLMRSVAPIFALLLALAAAAQDVAPSQPPSSPEDEKNIAAARQTPASELDPKLPKQPLGSWLEKLVAPSKIDWEVNDCGEQSGTPADEDRDFPMCVEANADLAGGRHVTVSIAVGTVKKGISGKPGVFFILLDEPGSDEKDVVHLSDLAARLQDRHRGSRPATPPK